MSLPAVVRVVIEVPRWGFVKRDAEGRVDYISPFPSPFNYGSVPATVSADGEGLDALVLGARLPRGWAGEVPVRARVLFEDGGEVDDKLVCADRPLRTLDRWVVIAFFWAYGLGKRVGGLGRRGPSGYRGWEEPARTHSC